MRNSRGNSRRNSRRYSRRYSRRNSRRNSRSRSRDLGAASPSPRVTSLYSSFWCITPRLRRRDNLRSKSESEIKGASKTQFVLPWQCQQSLYMVRMDLNIPCQYVPQCQGCQRRIRIYPPFKQKCLKTSNFADFWALFPISTLFLGYF